MTHESRILLFFIAQTAFDLALVLWLLLRRPRTQPDTRSETQGTSGPAQINLTRVLACVVALAAAFLAKAVVFAPFGLHLFGWMNIIFLDAVIVAPLAALVVLIATRRDGTGCHCSVSSADSAPACHNSADSAKDMSGCHRSVSSGESATGSHSSVNSGQSATGCHCSVSSAKRTTTLPVRALALAVVFLVPPLAIYGTVIEPDRLVLERAAVPLAPTRAGREPIRIAVLADIQTDHIGDHEHAAIDLAMAQKPDLILLPGDVLQGRWPMREREMPALRHLLNKLNAPGGVWFVQGDCERRSDYARMFEGTPVRLLHNEIASLIIRDRRVTLAGVELDYESAAAADCIRQLERGGGAEDIRILMAHRPDAVSQLDEDSRIDLLVAGHTHGGQIVIPGFGPPVTFSSLPRHVCAGGLHEVSGNSLYVSRGVGMERGQAPRIRLFCPPEVSLLQLE